MLNTMKFGNYNENLTNNISFPVKFEKRDVKFVCHVFRFPFILLTTCQVTAICLISLVFTAENEKLEHQIFLFIYITFPFFVVAVPCYITWIMIFSNLNLKIKVKVVFIKHYFKSTQQLSWKLHLICLTAFHVFYQNFITNH